MLIYTGQTTGSKLEKIKILNMGVMISSNPNTSPSEELKKIPCALDNGAFTCYSKGYPFQADVFMNTLKKCYKLNIKLDFITCPDIVCGGKQSLEYSLRWAKNELFGCPNLALVLQDGMEEPDLNRHNLKYFSYLFIGGSVKWKWETAKMWARIAEYWGKKLHIGQCGKLKYLEEAKKIGANSVDSTSFTVNDSFDIVEIFTNQQLKLDIN